MKKTIAVMICLLLLGCSHVPLGSMLKLSAFDENSFLSLNPHELRSRIQIDKPVEIDISKTALSLNLETSNGWLVFDYPLKVLSIKNIHKGDNNWFTSATEFTEYEFALSDEAVHNFQALQEKMQLEKPKSYRLNIDTELEKLPDDQDEIILSIFVRLSAESDYITLFDRESFDVEEHN